MALERTSMFVEGKWQECAEGGLIDPVGPSTEQTLSVARRWSTGG